ncbi:glycosyltransferase family 39 protein, partial [Candidatus Gottesmanbacteria bacterium]|nr:glycosyltransferase family 39 protein [Candidatus Gottesmanbacteria bacterium]
MKKNFWVITLIVITLLAIVLRLRILDTYPLDRDELARVVPEFTFTSFVPPGFLFLTKASAFLFNNSDFGFRLPVFLFGVLGIPLIYLMGKVFFGKLTGILSALVLSLLLTHIGYSNQAKEYVPLMSFATLSSIFVFKIINFPTKRICLLYSLISLLGIFFSSYFYFLVIFYQLVIISAVFIPRHWRIITKFPLNLAIGAVFIFLGFSAFYLINRANAYFGIKIITPEVSFIGKYWQELGYFVTQDVEFTKIMNLLFLVGMVFLPWIPKFRRGVFYIVSFIALDFLLVSTVRFKHSAFPIYYIRYHAFLLPLYVVMVSGTIEGVVHLLSQNGEKLLATAVISLFIFFNLQKAYPLLRWYYRLPSLVSTNFRDAGKYLTAHLQKGDTLVRLKNFSMEQKYNHVNHYIDQQVLKSINYSIFPERTAKNNWYVTLGPGDEDELGFTDYLTIERIRPSLRFSAPTISRLKYYGPFIKTRKLADKNKWEIRVSSGESLVGAAIDGDFETSWEGQDFKTMSIDLGAIYTLNSVRLYFSELYPQKFSLWLSEDGTTKKEMFNFRSLDVDPPNSQIFFPPTKARFIMMELKGSGIKEIKVWEVYKEEINDLNMSDVFDNGLPGIQIKDKESPNGYAQFIPYDKNDDYTFF